MVVVVKVVVEVVVDVVVEVVVVVVSLKLLFEKFNLHKIPMNP